MSASLSLPGADWQHCIPTVFCRSLSWALGVPGSYRECSLVLKDYLVIHRPQDTAHC